MQGSFFGDPKQENLFFGPKRVRLDSPCSQSRRFLEMFLSAASLAAWGRSQPQPLVDGAGGPLLESPVSAPSSRFTSSPASTTRTSASPRARGPAVAELVPSPDLPQDGIEAGRFRSDAHVRLRHSREITRVCSRRVTHRPNGAGDNGAGDDNALPICGLRAKVRCRGWATLSEHKWSSFGERRGRPD